MEVLAHVLTRGISVIVCQWLSSCEQPGEVLSIQESCVTLVIIERSNKMQDHSKKIKMLDVGCLLQYITFTPHI